MEGSGYELFQNFSTIVPFGPDIHLTHQLSCQRKGYPWSFCQSDWKRINHPNNLHFPKYTLTMSTFGDYFRVTTYAPPLPSDT